MLPHLDMLRWLRAQLRWVLQLHFLLLLLQLILPLMMLLL